jgi:hypothetical protein
MPASRFDGMPPRFDASEFHPEFGYLAPTMRFRRKVALTLMGALWGVLIGAGTGAVLYAVMDREEQKAHAMLASPVLTPPATSTPASALPPAAAPSAPLRYARPRSVPRPPRVVSVPPTPAPPAEPSSTPKTPAPTRTAVANASAEVRFVPQSIALPMVAPRDPEASSPTVVVEAPSMPAEPVVAEAATPVVDDPPAPVVDEPPAPVRQVRAPPRSRKRAVREARSERTARESRSERTARGSRSERIAREPRSERSVRYYPPPEPDPRTGYAGQYRPYGTAYAGQYRSYGSPYYRFGW